LTIFAISTYCKSAPADCRFLVWELFFPSNKKLTLHECFPVVFHKHALKISIPVRKKTFGSSRQWDRISWKDYKGQSRPAIFKILFYVVRQGFLQRLPWAEQARFLVGKISPTWGSQGGGGFISACFQYFTFIFAGVAKGFPEQFHYASFLFLFFGAWKTETVLKLNVNFKLGVYSVFILKDHVELFQETGIFAR
jgi:hypothetical protein